MGTNSTVTNNVAETGSFDPSADYWKGGGGIYNGSGATLSLVDSTVSGNSANLIYGGNGMNGGGIFGFHNSTTYITRSTLSGNEAKSWYGGAIYLSDGVMDILNSTIVENIGPNDYLVAIFVGSFGAANATLNLTNSIFDH